MCAIDDSEGSSGVAEAARWLARELGAPVLLAHVFDAMAIPVPMVKELRLSGMTPEHMVEVERRRARDALDARTEMLTGVDHTTAFVEGLVVPELLRLAREHDARLLVTGRDVRTPVERLMSGSVSSELAVQAPCPLVVVPDAAALGQAGPVIAAHDGSDHGRRAVRHGAILAAGLRRGLVLVRVVEPSDPTSRADAELDLHAARAGQLEILGDRLGADLDVTVAIERGDPVHQLATAARDRAAPRVVMGTRGRGAVGEELLGSVSAGTVCAAGRPVVLAGPRS